MLYFVRFQSHGGRGLCFIYFLRKGWGSVETTGFHMFLLEACHVKKYNAVSFGMFGAEYRAGYIDYVCPWRGAEQSEGRHFLLGQLQGEVDRTTRGPCRYSFRQGSPIHQKIHTEEDKYICIYTKHCVSIIHLCKEIIRHISISVSLSLMPRATFVLLSPNKARFVLVYF